MLSFTLLPFQGEKANCFISVIWKYRWFVFVPYDSLSNSPTEAAPYADADECPLTKNKWFCAFLPTTSCSLPDVLTSCSGSSCCECDLHQSYPMYSAADTGGYKVLDAYTMLSFSAVPGDKEAYEGVKRPVRDYHQSVQQSSLMTGNEVFSISQYLDADGRPGSYHLPSAYEVLRVIGQGFRLNARYRTHLAKRLQVFDQHSHARGLPPLSSAGQRCSVLHVKRGERMAQGEKNMTEW